MKLTRTAAWMALAIMTAQAAHAAVPKGKPADASATKSKSALVEATREVLNLPLNNRLAALREQGPQGYRNLISIMFNDSMPMESRWRAVTAAGRIGGPDSKPELERALKSNEWFMRNAGLVALSVVDREAALDWAKKLLSDKALVVRSAAVDAIQDLRDHSSTSILWEKLHAKENFKGAQSLFIRRRIVEALAQLELPGKVSKFIEVLGDADESLHAPAIAGLERMTRITMGGANEPTKFKREAWQKWWKDNKSSARM